MPTVTVRAGQDDRELFLFCLNGWGELPYLSEALDPVAGEHPVLAWLPPEPADAVRTRTIERFAWEHAARLPACTAITVVGYSHGGIAALATARHLIRRYGRQARLVILECPTPMVFLDEPLSVEFCRSAPFDAPKEGPLFDALTEYEQSISGRPVTGRDIARAVVLVRENTGHIFDLAVRANPELADLWDTDLIDKLTEWLCYLMLLRAPGPVTFDGPVDYVQTKQGRQRVVERFGVDNIEIAAWRDILPQLTPHRLGELHWGMLSDQPTLRMIFRADPC